MSDELNNNKQVDVAIEDDEDDDDEDWPIEEHLPEFDRNITFGILEVLQKRGENVLMDELIDGCCSFEPSCTEWDVARVLDVLVSLNLAAIEKQRGNPLRNSRAFAYRTGYALPKLVELHKLRSLLQQQELITTERVASIKRIKQQLDNSNSKETTSDVEFLQSYIQEKKIGNEDAASATVQEFLASSLSGKN